MDSELRPPQPDEYPPVVYKYRDWQNDFHKRVLINLELFLSSPAKFNDPFDCKIPIAYRLLKNNRSFKEKYFLISIKRLFPLKNEIEIQDEVNTLLNDPKFDTEEWIKEQEDHYKKMVEENFGVISLTEHKDDILMWSHYANSHSGFCIGFKSEKLFFNDKRFGSGGKVQYTHIFPEINPCEEYIEQSIKVLYTKLDVWKYEDEYRLTKIYAANKTVRFSPDEVSEIIIGCSMNKSDTESILNICKCNLPNVSILKAVQEKYDFKLRFERIQ